MKILFLNPIAQIGGAERSLLDVMSAVRAAQPDWEFNLLTGAEAGPLTVQAHAIGVRPFALPLPERLARLGEFQITQRTSKARAAVAAWYVELGLMVLPALRYSRRLRTLIDGLAPDLVHSNGLKMHILATWALPAGTPLVWHFHDYASSRPVMARLLRYRARHCRAVLANSISVADDARALLGSEPPVYLLYNAVDLARFNPDGPQLDLDALAGMAPAPIGTIRVGLMATMARWKGHEVFIRALAALGARTTIRGYLIGGPIYQTGGSQYALHELKELAHGLGLSERLGFTGLVDQPADAIRALDIVVHASTQPEPFGLVIAEAMACGKALVASRIGAVPELIRDGYDALTHAPGDSQELAAAISRLAGDEPLRNRLGRAARATALARFNRSRLARELVPLYKRLVEGTV